MSILPVRRFIGAALLVLLVLFCPFAARADVSLGVGSSSVFSSRFVPVVEAGWSNQNFGVFGSTGGVRTSSSFYNAYELKLMGLWSPGNFWWGKLTAGFGGGFFYAAEGFRPSGGATQRTSDWTVGPAIRLHWAIFKPVFAAADCTFGLRNPFSIFGLYVQDIARLSIGVQL